MTDSPSIAARGEGEVHRAAGFLLIALAFILPFELKTPLVEVGPLAVTNVELVLYLMLLAWAAWRVRFGVRAHGSSAMAPSAAHLAVAAWVVAMFLSAAVADTYRGQALKFALRSLGGCLLFVAATDLVGSRRVTLAVALGLAAGAVVSAAAGIAEIWVPGAAEALMAFKTQPSYAGGLLRASGTFQYANTAGMYWEATLPFLVLLGTAWPGADSGWARLARWGSGCGAVVVSAAIVLSASRAALAVAAMMLAALVVACRRHPAARTTSAVALVTLLVLTLAPGRAGLLATRLASDDQASWYRARYETGVASLAVEAGRWVKVPVRLTNTGRFPWPAAGEHPVRLSYHWADRASAEILYFEGHRNALPGDVAAGQSVTVDAWVRAPDLPGVYDLQWDVVQEGVIWFSTVGSPVGPVPVTVTSAAPAEATAPSPAPPTVFPQVRPPRAALWRGALRMWRERPWLGVGPDNYRRLYGPYIGLGTFDDRITSNNLYIEMLANLGLVGAAAFGAIVVAIGVRLWRSARAGRFRPGRDQGGRVCATDLTALTEVEAAVLAGTTLSSGAFLLHGTVDYFLEFTPTYGLFWIAAAMTLRLSDSRRAGDPESPAAGAGRQRGARRA
jgi:hypothetical protein